MRKILCIVLMFSLQAGSMRVEAKSSHPDSLRKQLRAELSPSKRLDVLLELTKVLQYQKPAEGIPFGTEALALAKQGSDTSRIIKALSLLGGSQVYSGATGEGESSWREAYRLASVSGDSLELGIQSINLGGIHDSRGELDTASSYYQYAINLFSRLDQPYYLAVGRNNLGIIYEIQGQYSRAADQYLKALSGFEEIGNQGGVAAVFDNLANIYFRDNQLSKAIQYCHRSMQMKESLEDKRGIALTLNNLGSIYQQQDLLDSARYYFQASADLKTEIGDTYGIPITYFNLGMVLSEQRSAHEAEGYLHKALEVAKETGDVSVEGKAYIGLGEYYLTQGASKKAESFLLKGRIVAEKAGEGEDLLNVHKALYRYYRTQRDPRAFSFHDQYALLRDSLRNDDQARELTRLEMKYEFEKETALVSLEQEKKEALLRSEVSHQRLLRNVTLGGLIFGMAMLIVLWRGYLQKQDSNRQLTHQKEVIQKALHDREILLQEIHHRVKNNLQVVSSLLSLQSRTIEDPIALDAIEEGRNRVKAMALIHQNLYQKENLVGVDLPRYMEKLTDNLLASYQVDEGKVRISREIASIPVDVDTLVPVGLIVNELISNALKYAFPEGREGHIHVRISEDPNQLHVSVSDDGIGLPQGFEAHTRDTMGFKLINAFVKKLNAKLEISSRQGTSVRLAIPGR